MILPTSYRQQYLAELARRVFAQDKQAQRQLKLLKPEDQRSVLTIVSRLETARLLYEQKDQDSIHQNRE